MEFKHISVLLDECITGLNLKSNGVYVDGTLGGGGHTEKILEKIAPNGVVIGIDKDTDALNSTTKRLDRFGNRLKTVHNDFKNIDAILDELKIDKIDGALLDLGVSSYQLDNKERGFSYMALDSELDMRMDRSKGLTAKDVLNTYGERELTTILRDYGEEKFAYQIVKNIIKKREISPLKYVKDLVEIIDNTIPKKYSKEHGHSAKKTFQALRIEVNAELKNLHECIISFVNHLNKGGRLAVITFHSLEDRIVKNAFKYLELDCICDKHLPICVCDKQKEIDILTKKPILPSEEEMQANSRSRSAKLRIAEKII